MSKLYFKYGVMGSSKSAQALMCKFNYEQQNFKVLLLKPSIDTRDITNDKIVVKSRIGLESECSIISKDENLYKFIFNKNQFKDKNIVIVDECQFLTTNQVNELKEVSRKIPVICYGLLTNFKTELFEGSKRLIEISDSLMEIKAVCSCGKKATVNARLLNNKLVTEGDEILLGGNETYKALCYNCYMELKQENTTPKLLIHTCCAPCASGVIPQIEGYDITLLFYNPNIDTKAEYDKRADALINYVHKYNIEFRTDIKYIIAPYDHNEFINEITNLEKEKEGGARCARCIEIRLDRTAQFAKEQEFDIFASTLSVSPHKNAEMINELGNEISKKYNIEYLPSNFKKKNGFINSVNNSKKYEIYRQKYCGCEFAKSHLKWLDCKFY